MVQVMLESIERMDTGRDLSEVADVVRLAVADLPRGDGLWMALGAVDRALAARITSPSQPEDSASVTNDRVVANRMAS